MGLIHWQRRLATGANAVAVAALVISAIGLLVDTADRVAPRWDLTRERSATLRPETRSVLEQLEERGIELEILAFSAQDKDALARVRDRMLQDFLRELDAGSDRVHTRFVDFDRDRLTAEQLGVDQYGTVVLTAGSDRIDLADRALFRRSGGKGERTVAFVGEGALVAGIEQLLASGTRSVYALTGHGEVTPYDRGLGDLHGLADVLTTLGLRVRTLDLLKAEVPDVPEDAAALLIVAPRAAMPPAEQEAIRAYLHRGGGVAIWLEPDGVIPTFVEELGLVLPAGVVMDPRSLYPWEDRPLLVGRRHPITEGLLAQGVPVVAGHAGPLRVVPVDGVRAAPVLGTSRGGWVERGSERPATFDPPVDLEGPVDVAVALEVGDGRLIAVGDADLVGDPLIDEGPGNRSFAGSLIRWTLGDDRVAAPIGAPRTISRMILTPAQLSRVRLGLVGLWPLAILLCGAALRWSRSRR